MPFHLDLSRKLPISMIDLKWYRTVMNEIIFESCQGVSVEDSWKTLTAIMLIGISFYDTEDPFRLVKTKDKILKLCSAIRLETSLKDLVLQIKSTQHCYDTMMFIRGETQPIQTFENRSLFFIDAPNFDDLFNYW